jgi:cell division septal protein FtsQ
MKSSLKIYFLLFIFLIFSTYSTKQSKENFSFFFPIKKIVIVNSVATNLSKFKSDLRFLINSSLFFLNEEKILITISSYDFISSVQIKKIYPNTLKVIIFEKIPVATKIIDKRKFYVTKDMEKINFIDLKAYENLPSIFGNYRNFNSFYDNLKKNNFKMKKIKAFYYFDVGRWDIVLKNETIIKLPEKNYLDLLPKINLMLDDSDFFKYKIFDFRIKNQLILK